MDQILLTRIDGTSTALCRLRTEQDTWLILKEVHTKIVSMYEFPLQTFRNHISRHAVKQRFANPAEVTFLVSNGAIGRRADKVTCLETQNLADMLLASLGDIGLATMIQGIATMPAYGSQNPGEGAASGLQAFAGMYLISCSVIFIERHSILLLRSVSCRPCD